jgi:dipeptidyl aminopeptidase/acylaminoacyl peptidase
MGELTLADVLDVEYPDAPAWTGDGRHVVATLYEDDDSALVVADVDGETARYRPGGAGVTDVVPAPEGSTLLVTTTDDRTLLVDADDGSETALLEGVESEAHAWASDGERVACYLDGALAIVDVSGGVRRFDVPERGPYLGESRMVAWGPDDDRVAYRFVERETKHVGVVDAASGDLLWRTDGPGSDRDPAWLADGRVVVDRTADRRRRREIVACDPADGTETVLVEDVDERGVVSRGAPAVSPDGTRLALALPFGGWEHVHVVDGDGERTQVTAGEFEDKGLADSTPRWLGDDELVFASNRDAPEERAVYAASLDGAVRPLVTTRGTNVHPRPSPDGSRLAYVHADRERSPELRVRTLEGGDAGAGGDAAGATPDDPGRRLTRSAVDDWPADPVAPERVVLPTEDDYEVPAFLLDPRETDAVADDATDLPTVVWVHGGPMRQMRDGWHPGRAYGLAYAVQQYLAREGYVGLLVNYRGGIGYGRRFRQGISADPGREIDDDVVAAAAFARDLEYTSEGVGVWGLSYGGYATLRALGTAPAAFDVGVNLAGVADRREFEPWATTTKYPPVESRLATTLGGQPWEAPEAWAEASPVTHMDDYESPLYNFHGTADRYVDVEQLDAVVDRLLGTDADFEFEYFPGESHVFRERRVWERVLAKLEDAFDSAL